MWMLDFETCSSVGIEDPTYTFHESTNAICMAYGKRGSDDPFMWWGNVPHARLHTIDLDPDFVEYVKAGGILAASNAPFDRAIWENICVPDYGFPETKPEQWYCTQAQARVAGLPSALDKTAQALQMKVRKDRRGSELIKKCCIPPFSTEVQDYIDLANYCLRDFLVMSEASLKIPDLSPYNLRDYHMNELINSRGICVDVDLAKAATQYAEDERAEIAERILEVTCGDVEKSTQHKRFKEWLLDCLLDDGNEDAVKLMTCYVKGEKKYSSDKTVRANLLAAHSEGDINLAPDLVEAIQLWDDAGGSAVAKFGKMARKADPDDSRVRGVLRYAGAQSTQRFSSMGLQIHNFRRDAYRSEEAEHYRALMLAGKPLVDMEGAPVRVMETLGRLLRSAIVPKPGHVLVVGDWSSVESRVTAGLADDQAKLDVFRRGDDPYCYAASSIYGRTITPDDKDERQVGKVTDLACFEGDVEVLTDSGWLPIQYVTPSHKVFDGIEFVACDGAIYQGHRLTKELDGIMVTGDHKFYLGAGQWQTTDDLKDNTIYLKKALGTARLKLNQYLKKTLGESLASNAYATAGQSLAHRSVTYLGENLLGVIPALRKPQLKPSLNTTLLKTLLSGADYKAGYPLSFHDAPTHLIRRSVITEAEVLRFTAPGLPTAVNSCDTFAPWTTMINAGLLSIGSITTKGTSPVTCALSVIKNSKIIKRLRYGSNTVVRECQQLSLKKNLHLSTSALIPSFEKLKRVKLQTKSYKTKSTAKVRTAPVYDILNAGPLNRYLVKTKSGVLLAHNCGFLGGQGALSAMATAYGLHIEEHKRQEIVNGWRAAHPKIVRYGDVLMNAAIKAVSKPGPSVWAGKVIYQFNERDGALYCRLPDGETVLRYHDTRIEMKPVPWDQNTLQPSLTCLKAAFTAAADAEEWPRHGLWRGKLLENCVQASCASLLRRAVRECEAEDIPIVFHVHDELVAEVPESDAEEAKEIMQEIMQETPEWLKGVPLEAEPEVMTRYGK